jgi:hypothetical protein
VTPHLALIFGTLLSSQGTDAFFEGFSGPLSERFFVLLCFQLSTSFPVCFAFHFRFRISVSGLPSALRA